MPLQASRHAALRDIVNPKTTTQSVSKNNTRKGVARKIQKKRPVDDSDYDLDPQTLPSRPMSRAQYEELSLPKLELLCKRDEVDFSRRCLFTAKQIVELLITLDQRGLVSDRSYMDSDEDISDDDIPTPSKSTGLPQHILEAPTMPDSVKGNEKKRKWAPVPDEEDEDRVFKGPRQGEQAVAPRARSRLVHAVTRPASIHCSNRYIENNPPGPLDASPSTAAPGPKPYLALSSYELERAFRQRAIRINTTEEFWLCLMGFMDEIRPVNGETDSRNVRRIQRLKDDFLERVTRARCKVLMALHNKDKEDKNFEDAEYDAVSILPVNMQSMELDADTQVWMVNAARQLAELVTMSFALGVIPMIAPRPETRFKDSPLPKPSRLESDPLVQQWKRQDHATKETIQKEKLRQGQLVNYGLKREHFEAQKKREQPRIKKEDECETKMQLQEELERSNQTKTAEELNRAEELKRAVKLERDEETKRVEELERAEKVKLQQESEAQAAVDVITADIATTSLAPGEKVKRQLAQGKLKAEKLRLRLEEEKHVTEDNIKKEEQRCWDMNKDLEPGSKGHKTYPLSGSRYSPEREEQPRRLEKLSKADPPRRAPESDSKHGHRPLAASLNPPTKRKRVEYAPKMPTDDSPRKRPVRGVCRGGVFGIR
ncbi:hypothetical protein BU16DRAFT_556416 [Lophium mytilinum]|uniref:Uncharacterized protein n=1 Tax=Lophium mytilinum TaxID=390894 RepID=A0A6A6R636_9PEZI|nr:hypothetical protein BU16DRAFT_556416 [Lophium mytilinum]